MYKNECHKRFCKKRDTQKKTHHSFLLLLKVYLAYSDSNIMNYDGCVK